MLPSLAPQLGQSAAVAGAMGELRDHGAEASLRWIQKAIALNPVLADPTANPLLHELAQRLGGEPGPRVLLDGLWFGRPAGGITRVWEQILHTWSLPKLISPEAPLLIIDREGCLALISQFNTWNTGPVDPLDMAKVAELSADSASIAANWGADIFLSSWISCCGTDAPAIPELAFVHDCLPERSHAPSDLMRQRRRWLTGARGFLAVSAATAQDLEGLLRLPPTSIPWCHSAPAACFLESSVASAASRLWERLSRRAGLRTPYVVLPATSSIGSYKNPELVAQALGHPALQGVQLLLCGVGAEQHGRALEQSWPALEGRICTAGFTDLELVEVFRRALAVVVPSRIEGFGLPVVEALATGATVLIGDSRGLREAAAAAAPRFDVDQPDGLTHWLQLLLDPPSRSWLLPHLQRRAVQRLANLNPDLLGLALLAQARRISEASGAPGAS